MTDEQHIELVYFLRTILTELRKANHVEETRHSPTLWGDAEDTAVGLAKADNLNVQVLLEELRASQVPPVDEN